MVATSVGSARLFGTCAPLMLQHCVAVVPLGACAAVNPAGAYPAMVDQASDITITGGGTWSSA